MKGTERLAGWVAAEGARAERLRRAADALRRRVMGDAVHLRGIIEFSNHCANNCLYCGIRRGNPAAGRYRIPDGELLAAALDAKGRGCGTVVLQSGEDAAYPARRLAELVRRVKGETGLAVTLSVGVRPRRELDLLRAAGADRYLLRFETSDRALFRRIHPDGGFDGRIRCLGDLRAAGFQVGSGFMIGLPGATAESTARDLLFTRSLDLDMIGCGPFLANPQTPLSAQPAFPRLFYYNVMALLRLMNPRAHLPATTAFAALEPGGRGKVLRCGANVYMPNVTPMKYRALYALYPGKPDVDGESEGFGTREDAAARLRAIGRTLAVGPGDALRNYEL